MHIAGPRLSFGSHDMKGSDPWSRNNRRVQRAQDKKEADVIGDAFEKAKGGSGQPAEKGKPATPPKAKR